mgnify:CR=1 FL=1
MRTMAAARVQSATLEDAVQLALDEALAEAGFARACEQVVARELEAALVDSLVNDDATLQQAARAAVRRYQDRLAKEWAA